MKVAAEFCFLFLLLNIVNHCRADIPTGHQVALVVPSEYSEGFIGRAFVIETGLPVPPNFRAALAVEAAEGNFSCSLQVFLGEVKVWSSDHFSRFYTADKCVLELTNAGDLQLKGPAERVGWRTGTSGQGVERLRILRTGNLALVDALDRIKWQSFNFPTDVMLWGQSLNVATELTSFPTNSTSFYSFEIQTQKIALYLNSGKLKYSYWEFKPPNQKSISFIKLGSAGLDIYNERGDKIAAITPSQTVVEPMRFLALGNSTGNLGLYSYSPQKGTFEASFRALNATCDLPLACKPYGVCTFSNSCSCIRLQAESEGGACGGEIAGEFCGETQAEMLELEGIGSILREEAPERVNISKQRCGNVCLEDCKCGAALYLESRRECYLYGGVMGVKQIEKGMGSSYLVKVPKGTQLGREKKGLKKWILVVVGVVDGFIILLVCGGLAYYFINRRRKNFTDRDTHS